MISSVSQGILEMGNGALIILGGAALAYSVSVQKIFSEEDVSLGGLGVGGGMAAAGAYQVWNAYKETIRVWNDEYTSRDKELFKSAIQESATKVTVGGGLAIAGASGLAFTGLLGFRHSFSPILSTSVLPPEAQMMGSSLASFGCLFGGLYTSYLGLLALRNGKKDEKWSERLNAFPSAQKMPHLKLATELKETLNGVGLMASGGCLLYSTCFANPSYDNLTHSANIFSLSLLGTGIWKTIASIPKASHLISDRASDIVCSVVDAFDLSRYTFSLKSVAMTLTTSIVASRSLELMNCSSLWVVPLALPVLYAVSEVSPVVEPSYSLNSSKSKVEKMGDSTGKVIWKNLSFSTAYKYMKHMPWKPEALSDRDIDAIQKAAETNIPLELSQHNNKEYLRAVVCELFKEALLNSEARKALIDTPENMIFHGPFGDFSSSEITKILLQIQRDLKDQNEVALKKHRKDLQERDNLLKRLRRISL